MTQRNGALGRLVECVPNFSEGCRRDVVDSIVGQMTMVAGVRVLDVEMDASHNRAVVTIVGNPEAVAEAAFRAVREAARLIDMEQHRGQHPRVGATDVVPFVPLRGVTMMECVQQARQLGERIAQELDLPVYLYGEAALRPERRDLPSLRRGEYEGLKADIAGNPERAPDYGPPRLGSAGATIVGARPPLIAFNVNLATTDLTVARAIARKIRESNGGLPAVRALGVDLPDLGEAQVSMNLTDFRRTSILEAYEAVQREAVTRGITIVGSEIVGLVPEAALPADADRRLKLQGFRSMQVLERNLDAL